MLLVNEPTLIDKWAIISNDKLGNNMPWKSEEGKLFSATLEKWSLRLSIHPVRRLILGVSIERPSVPLKVESILPCSNDIVYCLVLLGDAATERRDPSHRAGPKLERITLQMERSQLRGQLCCPLLFSLNFCVMTSMLRRKYIYICSICLF